VFFTYSSTITTATRITKETKTLLDHPGIIDYQISDHSFTFVILENKMHNNKTEKSEPIIKNKS